MRAMVIVEVLPFGEFVVEHLGVVDDDALEPAVELLAVDPVGPLYLAVQAGCGGLDVDVPDAAVGQVPVERGLELRTVVGLDRLDPERQLIQQVVREFGWRSSGSAGRRSAAP